MKKKTKKKKPQVFYVWKHKDGWYLEGRPFYRLISYARFSPPAIYNVDDWRKAYADGWRIVKAKLVEVE